MSAEVNKKLWSGTASIIVVISSCVLGMLIGMYVFLISHKVGTDVGPRQEFGCNFPRAPGSSGLSLCLLS